MKGERVMERTTTCPGCGRSHSAIFLAAVLLVVLGACGEKAKETTAESPLSEELIGTWFAYHENVIENMWTFRRDGTCINDGWPGTPAADSPALPYHLEGTYIVSEDEIAVVVSLEGGMKDTVHLNDPGITMNRLIYSTGKAPVVFLRERAAVGQEMVAAGEAEAADPELAKKLVGSWVALTNGFPVNTWRFDEDGTFLNEGWERMNLQTFLVRRLYQVTGHYTVSGQRVVLTNEKLLQFDPETNRVDTEVPISERIVLYDAVVSKGRLVYTNEVGLPVAFRLGVVTPTNW